MHVELVRIYRTLHHRFAQAVAGGNEHHIRKTGLGVDGEHHAGCAQIGAHHALDTGTQGHHVMRKALVHAVADGAVVIERGKHFADLVQDVFDADDVQEGFLLAGKRGVWQVFCGGGGAHGKRSQGIAGAEYGKGFTNALLQSRWKRLHLQHGADFGTSHGQGAHVLGIQRGKAAADTAGQVVMLQKFAKGVCRRGKAGRHLHALWQLGNHLPQTGVFAANRFDIGHAQMLKRYNQIGWVK